jgi:hypothetical protein
MCIRDRQLIDGFLLACDTVEHTLERDGNWNNAHKTGKIFQITPSVIAVSGGISEVSKIIYAKLIAEFSNYHSVEMLKQATLRYLGETWDKFETHYSDFTGDRDYLHCVIAIGGIFNNQPFSILAACEWGAKPVARENFGKFVYPPVDHIADRVHEKLNSIRLDCPADSLYSPALWEVICLTRDTILEISKTDPLIGGDFHFGIVRNGFDTQFGEYEYPK